MKIAYLMQAGVPDLRRNQFSGPAVHVRRVIEELRSLGNEVRLLAQMSDGIWASDDLEHYRRVDVSWLARGPIHTIERVTRRIQSALRLPWLALFDSVRYAMTCRDALQGFDLLYERMGWMGYGGGLASRLMRIPLVLEVNGDHLSELGMRGIEPGGLQRRISLWLMRMAARQAAQTVATGNGWRERHIQRWGVDPDKVKVIENGSEVVNLLRREQLKCFRVEVRNSEPINLVYVGAFEPWHGLATLLGAIAEVITRGLDLQVTLVGEGPQFVEIEQLVHTSQLGSVVTLTGQLPLPKIASMLTEMNIGLSPYCGRSEYSGLKLLDYKAAGLATIASGENGQPAVVKHGCTGLVVPPCQIDALAEAIVRLSRDHELRTEMGRRARIEAETQHSWAHTASELQNLFAQVLADCRLASAN